MAKTTSDSLKIEVWGSDRVAQGADALVAPSQSTIEKGFVDGIANANDFTWVPNVLGGKINHCLQNGIATWNNTTAYVAGNMVTHSNKAWQCLVGNTNSTPADGNANWDKMLSVSTPPTLNSVLPSQTGNSGRLLTTDGTNASWGNIPFAYVNFDASLTSNLTGTFTRTLAVVTANVTAHGHRVGDRIYLFSSGVLGEWGTVATVPNANSFTYTSGTSGTIGSTAFTLQRRSIRKALNVHSVPYQETGGTYAVNFTTPAPDANYALLGSAQNRSGANALALIQFHVSNSGFHAPTVNYVHCVNRNSSTANVQDMTDNTVVVFA
jgi:hypothetical protein